MKFNTLLITGITATLMIAAACGDGGKQSALSDEDKLADSVQIALNELNGKIEAAPNDAALRIERSKLLQTGGFFADAYADAEKAVSIDSLQPAYWLEVGKTAFAVEHYLRSEGAYLTCIAIDAKNTDCMVKLSEFYLIRRKYQEAMDFANKSLEVKPDLARPYFVKGWIYMETGDTAKSSTSYQTAVELDPNFYDAYIQLGSLASRSSKDVALDYFNSAIDIRPQSMEALYFKAMFLQNRKRYDEARQVYADMLVVDSNNANAYYNLGYIQLDENKPDSAILSFTKAISKNSRYAEAYYNRGYAYELTGKKSQAANDYKLSLSFNSKFELAQEGLARVQ
ncbi:MAG: tetratricopeptide repeat protein [Bacteroidota bacterium]